MQYLTAGNTAPTSAEVKYFFPPDFFIIKANKILSPKDYFPQLVLIETSKKEAEDIENIFEIKNAASNLRRWGQQ